MWTIFFDIDGTLIRTGGAGLVSMTRVMLQRCGIDKLPQVTVHGRTDYGIWRDVFHELDLDQPKDLRPFIEDYCKELEATLDPEVGIELPGVRRLLEQLSDRDDVACCLLTGNARSAARIKLDAFGLSTFFCEDHSGFVGGFGDATGCRNEVAKHAVESAAESICDFDLQRAWVIGDTVRDVACARSIGSKVMAVQTGGDSREELLESGPEHVVNDMSKVDEILQLLLV